MSAKRKGEQPTKTQIKEVHALARRLGWSHLNDREKTLIDTLRWTTWHGRNLVAQFAVLIRSQHPWIDGSPFNTTSPLTCANEPCFRNKSTSERFPRV